MQHCCYRQILVEAFQKQGELEYLRQSSIKMVSYVFALLILQAVIFCHNIAAFTPSISPSYKTFIQSVQRRISAAKSRHFASPQFVEMEDVEHLLIQAPISVSQRVFLINGWRWHTMSVVRDLRRLSSVANQIRKQLKSIIHIDKSIESSSANYDKLIGSYSFVYKFNWCALMQVERELFFPWLRSMLPNSMDAYIESMSSLHAKVHNLGDALGQECMLLKSSHELDISPVLLHNKVEEIDRMINDLSGYAIRIQHIQVGAHACLS